MGDADPETGVPYPLDFHEEPMYITQENATSYAKLRQRIAVIRKADEDKPFSKKELDKERKSYEESIKRKHRSPTESELTNRNVRLDMVTDYFNKSKKKFKKENTVTDREREADAIEREFVNRNRKVDPKKHKGGTLMRKKLKQKLSKRNA